jgi:predicted dehydrogenase
VTPCRMGVWGVGTWGEKHARVYHGLDDVTLVGVYDQDHERALGVAERYGCRAFPSAEALLDQCEAVSIAVPTVSHRAALEQAAAAGRHALVEKPMAQTVADADAMLSAARRAGIRLQVGHVERFNPALLAAGPHLSQLKFVEAHRLALFQPRSLDIDVVFDLMIHDIDAVLDSVGTPPSSVSAVGVAVLSENEDIANARLEFPDGCVANLTASRVSQERLRRIRFFQHDAYVSVDLFEKTCEMLKLGSDRAPGAGVPAGLAAAASFRRRPLEVGGGEPLTLQLQAFTASLRGGGAGAASGEAGRAALEVAAAVRAAMRQRAEQWALRSGAGS